MVQGLPAAGSDRALPDVPDGALAQPGASNDASTPESKAEESSLRLRSRLPGKPQSPPTASQTSAAPATEPHAVEPDPYPWLFRESPVGEAVKTVIGAALLVLLTPPVTFQMIICVLWDSLNNAAFSAWSRLSHRVQRSSPDKKAVLGTRLFTELAERGRKWCKRAGLVRMTEDAFFVPLIVWLAGVMPIWFFIELARAGADARAGRPFAWLRVLTYSIVRLGPMYASFMYVYVLSHKEAHRNGRLLAKPAGDRLRYVFNHWIGLFHGVLPGTFTYSHLLNHHRYDNSSRDVYTTAYRPRDRFVSFVRYYSEWYLYSSNVSSFGAFLSEGRNREASRVALGTTGYLVFVAICARVNLTFTLVALVYPFFESNTLLSVVNYTWHAFIEEARPTDDYINSTTIIEGLNFTLAEEYHVVHHQYAGVHWTRHRELYEHHFEEYKRYPPSAFYKVNIFELFFFIVSGNYGKLVELYYRPLLPNGWSDEQLEDLLRRRLRSHGPALACRVGRTYRGHLSDVAEVRDEAEEISTVS